MNNAVQTEVACNADNGALKGIRIDLTDVLASVCRDSFYEFVVEFWDTIISENPVFNWHIKYVCQQLQQMAERVFANKPKKHDLIINIAPGSTKSTIVSQMFPAWCWTRMPSARFICGSYAKDVALKDSIKCRDIILSEKYRSTFPGIVLREDENTKGLFTNTQMGFRYSAGSGGAVTGYHAHFIIIDDPINPEEAFSKTDLQKACRWITNTLSSRKVDKNVTTTILIQQRLHQADPTGDWLDRSKGVGVKHICLPGELLRNERNEPLYVNPPELAKYYTDDLFDPVRLSRPVLDEMLKDLGSYGYAGQVLQHPVPLGGGNFEVDRLIMRNDPPVRLVRIVRSWDKAGTQDGGNYTAGVLMGIDRDGIYWVLDVIRGQFGAATRERTIKQTAQLDGSRVEVELEIEGGSGGKESGENTVKNLAGFKVHITHPTGDKEARAYPFASQVGAGNVCCLLRAWTRDFVEELRYFPRGTYDDQVDAASAAFNRLAKRRKRIGGW